MEMRIKQGRNSNFEFLRIVAMMMILSLHVNFNVIGVPTYAEFCDNPTQRLTQIFFQAIGAGAVDLFVLISGWFGIRATRIGFAKFMYQCFAVIFFMLCVGAIIGKESFSLKFWNECVLFSEAWFVIAYAGLFLIAPVLNRYIEASSRRELGCCLVAFFVFQLLYGCISEFTNYFERGYSAFSFIGLYLLGRYVKLYGAGYLKYGKWLAIGMPLFNWAMFSLLLLCDERYYMYCFMDYTCPTVILAALGLVMWVATMKPRVNGVVNFVAASCFSVYLVHICNEWTRFWYKAGARMIFDRWSGVEYFAVIIAYMLAVFVFAVGVDQLRKISWNLIARLIAACRPARG